MNSILDIPGASGISPREAAASKSKYQLDPVTQLLADYITKQEAQQKAMQAAQNPALNKSVLEDAVEKTMGNMMGGALGALQNAMPQMAAQGAPQMPPQGAPQMPPQMPPQGAPQMPPQGMAEGGLAMLDFAEEEYADGGIIGYQAGNSVMATDASRRLFGALENIDFEDPKNAALLEQLRADEERRLAEQAEESARLEERKQRRQGFGRAGGRNFSAPTAAAAPPPARTRTGPSLDDIMGSTPEGMRLALDNLGRGAQAAPAPAPAPAPFGAPGASALEGLPGFSVSDEFDEFGFPVTSTISKALAMVNPKDAGPFDSVLAASEELIGRMDEEYAPVAASMADTLQALRDRNTPEEIKRRREKDLSLGLAEFGFRLASTGKFGESALGTMSELKKTLEGREGEQLADLARIADLQGQRADVVLKPLLQGFQTKLAEAGFKQNEINQRVELLKTHMAGEQAALRARLTAKKPEEYKPSPEEAAKYADDMLEKLLSSARDADSFEKMVESIGLPQSAISAAEPFMQTIFTQKGGDSEATRRAQEQFRTLMAEWWLADRYDKNIQANKYRI